MAHISPCHLCPLRDGCALRDEFRAQARALGSAAISVAFRCPRLAKEIRPGRRVVVGHPQIDGHDRDDGLPIIKHAAVPATVTDVGRKHRFVCVIDPGAITIDESAHANPRFRRRQAHYRIVRFLDEPDFPLCASGNVLRDGKCDTSENHCFCKQLEG